MELMSAKAASLMSKGANITLREKAMEWARKACEKDLPQKIYEECQYGHNCLCLHGYCHSQAQFECLSDILPRYGYGISGDADYLIITW